MDFTRFSTQDENSNPNLIHSKNKTGLNRAKGLGGGLHHPRKPVSFLNNNNNIKNNDENNHSSVIKNSTSGFPSKTPLRSNKAVRTPFKDRSNGQLEQQTKSHHKKGEGDCTLKPRRAFNDISNRQHSNYTNKSINASQSISKSKIYHSPTKRKNQSSNKKSTIEKVCFFFFFYIQKFIL